MDFFNVLEARQSVRAFKDRPVGPENLMRILEAMNRAPSAGNLQGYEVYLVRDEAHRAALERAAGDQEFLCQAPVVLVFCANARRSAERYGERGAQLYCVQDATIACSFAMLAATALGLATVWVGAFDEAEVHRIIGASPDERPVAMIPIGYAAESPQIRERRSLGELVHEVQ